jgi:hypothetical protein
MSLPGMNSKGIYTQVALDLLIEGLKKRLSYEDHRAFATYPHAKTQEEDKNELFQQLVRSLNYTPEGITRALTHGPSAPELDIDATMDQLEKSIAAQPTRKGSRCCIPDCAMTTSCGKAGPSTHKIPEKGHLKASFVHGEPSLD